MNQKVLLLLLLIAVLAFTVLLVRTRTEAFTGVLPDEVVEAGQERFNKFMDLVNLANSPIPLNPTTAAAVDGATNSLSSPGNNNQGVTAPFKVPTAPSPNLGIAQSVCEVVTTPSCSAFQTPAFAANCGISFDIKGKDSKGNPHRGGLFISAEDRTYQEQRATSLGLGPDDIQFTPTFGQARKGQFAVDAPTCQILQEKIQCQTTRDLTSPNCTQCFTSSEFHRLDPTTPRVVPALVFQTNATSLTINGTAITNIPVDTAFLPPIGGLNEGTPLVIQVSGPVSSSSSNQALYAAGYISATTIQGSFNLDLNALLNVDTVTGYRPRLNGTSQLTLNGANPVQCFNLVPQQGSSTMNLTGLMPFSFVDPSQYDARSCDNGPFVTQAASATFLNSDPCYDPASSKPGAYSTACLQQLFLGMGGTAAGSGYPSDATAALQLNVDSTTQKPRSLTDIGTFLSNMAVQAATGMNNGQELSISDWSAASVFMTGVSITSPCANSPPNGPLTAECLTYLYTNGGATNSIDKTTGPTYSLGLNFTTQDSCGNAVYCTPEGTLNPATTGGLKAAPSGGIAAVKATYDLAHRTANDNTLPNTQRRAAIQQCYGDVLERMNPEVFWVGGPNTTYAFTADQAASTCAQVGAVVATTTQLSDAQKNGAQWCSAGWVVDDTTATQTIAPSGQFPMQTLNVPGCNGPYTIAEYGGAVGGPSAIGVNCYGSKPDPSNVPSGLSLLPFTTVFAPDSSKPNGWNYNAGPPTWNSTFSD